MCSGPVGKQEVKIQVWQNDVSSNVSVGKFVLSPCEDRRGPNTGRSDRMGTLFRSHQVKGQKGPQETKDGGEQPAWGPTREDVETKDRDPNGGSLGAGGRDSILRTDRT